MLYAATHSSISGLLCSSERQCLRASLQSRSGSSTCYNCHQAARASSTSHHTRHFHALSHVVVNWHRKITSPRRWSTYYSAYQLAVDQGDEVNAAADAEEVFCCARMEVGHETVQRNLRASPSMHELLVCGRDCAAEMGATRPHPPISHFRHLRQAGSFAAV